MNRDDTALILNQLARYKGLSDGAKVTFLEFLFHFWTDKIIPSYTQLTEIRSMARSTIQLHIEELEQRGLVTSIRLPDNRKKYQLNLSVLTQTPRVEKRGRQEGTRHIHKPLAKYSTSDLCAYFQFQLAEMGGESKRLVKQDYITMKALHQQHGSTKVVEAIDRFKSLHKRRFWKFNVDTFAEHAEEIFRNRA